MALSLRINAGSRVCPHTTHKKTDFFLMLIYVEKWIPYVWMWKIPQWSISRTRQIDIYVDGSPRLLCRTSRKNNCKWRPKTGPFCSKPSKAESIPN